MQLAWKLVYWLLITVLLVGIVLPVIAFFVINWVTGQPSHIASNIATSIHRNLPWYIFGVVVWIALTVLAWFKQRDSAPAPSSPTPTTHIAGSTLSGSAVVTGDRNQVTVNSGLYDHIAQNRDHPSEVNRAMRTVGALLNLDDPDYRRTVMTDGESASYVLEARAPDALIRRPVRAGIEVLLPDGQTIEDIHRQAAETQEPVTIDHVRNFALYLGDTLIEQITQPGSLTISQHPLGPPITCALTIRGTEVRIDALQMEVFPVPEGKLRLTNRRQKDALIVVTFDFHLRPARNNGDSSTDEQDDAVGLADKCTVALEAHLDDHRALRQMILGYDLIRALREPRIVELYNYATYGPLMIGELDATDETPTPNWDRLMDALKVIQEAYPDADFVVPKNDDISNRDIAAVFELEHIITIGEEKESWAISGGNVTFYIDKLDQLPEDGVIGRLTLVEGCTFTLWGTTVPLGEVITETCPLKVDGGMEAVRLKAAQVTDSDSVTVNLVPIDPNVRTVVRRYARFRSANQ